MPPKKATELGLILIDVNSSANQAAVSNADSLSDFDQCTRIAEQLLTRKVSLFTCGSHAFRV